MKDEELLKKAMDICRITKNCLRCELYHVCCCTSATPYRVYNFLKVLRTHIDEE